MSATTLGKILDKAVSECEIPWVGLFNWTEPLLHPNIAELIQEVKKRNLYCMISSNLNLKENYNFEKLVESGLDWMRVSLSGFHQKTYEVGHAEGDIEIVKKQMIRLAAAKTARPSSPLSLNVLLHKYRYNENDIEPMREFAESLGYNFSTILAQMYPIEKLIRIHGGEKTADDIVLMNNLSLPVEEALALTSKTPRQDCFMMDDQMVIDANGKVILCCGTSFNSENKLGNYLDMPLQEIQSQKNQHELCSTCMKINIPEYFVGSAELETLVRAPFAN